MQYPRAASLNGPPFYIVLTPRDDLSGASRSVDEEHIRPPGSVLFSAGAPLLGCSGVASCVKADQQRANYPSIVRETSNETRSECPWHDMIIVGLDNRFLGLG